MKNKITVRQAVLMSLLFNYPRIKTHQIISAHRKHRYSGGQRFRELKAEGLIDYKYNHKDKVYIITTSLFKIKQICKRAGVLK